MSRDEAPRAIRISKAVKAALVELRLVEQTVTAPVLDRGVLDAVERELDFKVPDDLLATFAAHVDTLRDLGVTLEKLVANSAAAQAAGCAPELVAFGRAEGPIFYCVARKADGQVHEFDVETKATKRRALADWLSDLAEAKKGDQVPSEREEDEAADDADPAEVEVGKADLESFKPRLIAPPPSTGKQVRHATFGVGDVLREIGVGASRKFEVRFPSGTKVLIARVVEEL